MHQLVKVVETLASYLPNSYRVIFKTHPACSQNYTDLIAHFDNHSTISFDNKTPTHTLIAQASVVCTINSTVGIEALIQHKCVICLGQAFYNIVGLTHRARDENQLKNLFADINNLSVNHDLMQRFVAYLTDEYQISGDWRTPDAAHFAQLIIKIRGFICQSKKN